MPTETRESLGCARCGACCAPVHVYWPKEQLTRWLKHSGVDTDDPVVRRRWAAVGWDASMAEVRRSVDPDGPRQRNARFVEDHWTFEWADPTGPGSAARWTVTCSAYDPDARLCTAHDTRPPICADFPWYDRGPEGGVLGVHPEDTGPGDARLACSYELDLDPADRTGRPLIPLTVLQA